LKPVGFKRRGRTYNRSFEVGVVQVIRLQTGPFEIGAEAYGHKSYYGKLAVNLGVHVTEFFNRTNEGYPPKTIDDACCAIRTRLEALDGREDFSWVLTSDAADLCDDVGGLLLGVGVPWLDRFKTHDLILAEFHRLDVAEPHSRRWWWLAAKLDIAMLMLSRGDLFQARELLADQFRTTKIENHKDYVRELSVKLGLGPIQ
jgi:hypothetical protein